MRSNPGDRSRLISVLVVAVALASATGCVKHTRCEYGRQVIPLDARNEVVISTFPSAYPQVRDRIPFLFKRLDSPRSVNVEFFVRATGTAGGRNPHIDSILVRRLSYAFPGQAPVLLMENHPDGFWQQGQTQYASHTLEPVPCFEGWSIQAQFDLVLNGTTFKGERTLVAYEKSRIYPLLSDALR